MRSNQIYNEYLYEGLNQSSRRSMRLWEGAAIQLKEAALTPDQIQQIFTSVEQGATAGGANRTLIGKGKDAAVAVNKAWEDLKTKVQDSAPIKNVDSAYDSAVSKIEAGLGGPDNAVNQVIQKYRAFAKAHPVAQSLIYAALIAAAGISGAGLGGAAVLGLLKMTDKLLQGEKFSSAAYSGAKTGAMAYGASKVGDLFKGPQQPEIQPYGQNELVGAQSPGMGSVDDKFAKGMAGARAKIDAANAKLGIDGSAANYNASGTVSQAAGSYGDIFRGAKRAGLEAAKQAVSSGQITNYNSIQNVTDQIMTNIGTNLSPQSSEVIEKMVRTQLMAGMKEINNGIITRESFNLSENAIATLFTLVQIKNRQFNEGIWDDIKGAAGKAAGAVANKAATFGKNLTTKVTADKLNSAWKKAGSPTDSDAVAQVIQGAGVDPAVVSKAYTDLNIPAPAGKVEPALDQPAAASAVNTKDMLAQIMKLTPAEQQQVLAHLKK